MTPDLSLWIQLSDDELSLNEIRGNPNLQLSSVH